MTKNLQSKIQLRAKILKTLEAIKKDIEQNILDLKGKLLEFANIEDSKTLYKIIVKEIKGDGSYYDYFLSLILTQNVGSVCEDYIFETIMSDEISDFKKIFLINILKELNADADYEALMNSITNPETLADLETQKFVKHAIVSPSSQIDFLDFFFAIDTNDKETFLRSVVENSEGDEAANILSLIIYTLDKDCAQYALKQLGKTRSPFAFLPLEYAVKNFKDKMNVSVAKKALSELKLSGIRKKPDRKKLYADILQNSTPLNAWASFIDGTSSFALMFARKKDDSCISFFSVVLNLKFGALECFGLEDLERAEFREIAVNVFGKDKAFTLDIPLACKILETLTDKSSKIPYELLSWRQLTYDIEPFDENLEEYFKNSLEKIKLNDDSFDKIFEEQFFESCFIKYGDTKAFDDLINKINTAQNYEQIRQLFMSSRDDILNIDFDVFLLWQAYFLKCAKKENSANILYSVLTNDKYKEKMKNKIIQKSILLYYKDQKSDKQNIFSKQKTLKNKQISDLIGEKWKSEFWGLT